MDEIKYWFMRFVKVHPAFIVFFLISFLGLGVAFVTGINAMDACVSDTGTRPVDAECTLKGETGSNMAITLAIGSLTVAICGVGFQVGRSGTQAASVPPPGFPAGPVPFPQQPPR